MGTLALFSPPSIRRTERSGEAWASRLAIVQPAVPPAVDEHLCLILGWVGSVVLASADDYIDFGEA